MKLLNITLLLLVLGFSCTKKKYPEEAVLLNEPVFYFKADVDNVPYSLKAGVDNYRMYSSHTLGADCVCVFNADLKLNGCLSVCPNTLKIQINNTKKTNPGKPVDVNAALTSRNYEFKMPPQEVEFFCTFNKGAKSYEWNFGDGTTSTIAHPKHVYTKSGIYNVCLTISDYYGCKSTICNRVRVGYPDKPAFSNIVFKSTTGSSVKLYRNVVNGTAPYNYLWSFGDGTSINTNQDTVNHQYKYNGAYPVSLRVIDAKKDTSYAEYNVVTQLDNSSCAANYSVVAVKTLTDNLSSVLSQILVTWTDASGMVYTSDISSQPFGSYFQIVSVEDYEPNENNAPTKKIKLKFNCTVYNGTKSVRISNAEAVLCVSYN
ncbi:MAG: PKD domain-containing protein [Bacteroidia bacterium]|nr:PKD domain-containing protein [Bacteroidia bacterium]